MFEGIIGSLLTKYLGEYIEGISSESLKLSIWSGDVKLTNLVRVFSIIKQLKPDALKALNLPIEIKAGFVGNLTLKVI